MRTSLHELDIIEQALLMKKPEYKLLLKAKQQLDPSIAEHVNWQKISYQVIVQFGRTQLKKDIQLVDQELFSHKKHKSFRAHIRSFFSS
ncbi:MAG: hypothetical protein RJQ14_21575 [Marinoscillum sp.]